MKIKEIREEIEAQNLNIHGVCEWLEKYGSDGDPIFYRGEEITPVDLACHLEHYTPALNVRISFYGRIEGGGTGLRHNSNFAHMLKDRIDMYAARELVAKKQDRKPKVEFIVSWRDCRGVEGCGKTEYEGGSQTFAKRAEAKAHFVKIKQRHYRVKFRKVTDELLGESE